jgi:hypothetical protein
MGSEVRARRVLSIGVLFALVGATVCAVRADEEPRTGGRELVQRLGDAQRAPREEGLRGLLDLRASLVGTLPGAIAAYAAEGDRAYHGRLDAAIEVAGAYRISEATAALVALLELRLDKATFPHGGRLRAERLFPAAQALVKIGGASVPVDVLRRVVASDAEPLLRPAAWVLRELLGRGAAVEFVKAERERQSGASAKDRLGACVALLEEEVILKGE